MLQNARRWGVSRFDLIQIHNLKDWRTHLDTLIQWKAEGKVRFIGITTSHGRSHSELKRALRDSAFDFVQLTYNMNNREVEQELLPLAQEQNIAVIANRPFAGGRLFSQLQGRALPAWAAEFGIASWAQYFLKFIISHPAVTCAIPATSKFSHMVDNMGALSGRLPGSEERQTMLDFVA